MLVIFLSDNNSITVEQVGFAMFVSSLTARWGRLLFSPVFNYFKPKTILSIMQMFGAFGYLLLYLQQSFIFIIIALTFIGLFYGSNTIYIRVLTSFLKNENKFATKSYSIIHIGTNISATAGPILINLLYNIKNKEFVYLFMSSFLALSSILTIMIVPNTSITKQNNILKQIFYMLFSKKFWHIYFIILVCWFYSAQIYSLAPIIISKYFNLSNYIWTISSLNGLMIIFLSLPLNNFFNKYSKSNYLQILYSVILSFIGLSLLIYSHNLYNFYAGIIVLTLAEILFIPAIQALLTSKTNKNSRVAIFATYAVFVGLGEGYGYYFGTKSLDYFNSNLFLTEKTFYLIILATLLCIGICIKQLHHKKLN
jgi:predicted MFS family arabinose efflux permease